MALKDPYDFFILIFQRFKPTYQKNLEIQAFNHQMTNSVERIGIMADSHGIPGVIEEAIQYFNHQNCSQIYHLGDICDSGYPEDSDVCVCFLKKNSIIAVKGNNDHIVQLNHKDQPGKIISPETVRYLNDLPQVVGYRNAFFSHSLPFVKELGLAGMIWDMSVASALKFIADNPDSILFRGHSHTPEIKYLEGSRIKSEKIQSGQVIDLSRFIPCIITCGALMSKLCMIWEPDNKKLYIISFE